MSLHDYSATSRRKVRSFTPLGRLFPFSQTIFDWTRCSFGGFRICLAINRDLYLVRFRPNGWRRLILPIGIEVVGPKTRRCTSICAYSN